MELGPYYKENFKKIQPLADDDWRVAIKKCREHVKWRLRQKTLYGAHAAQRLGKDPVDYYVEISFEKILSGDWEWKDPYTLSQQMIRIADSQISTEVEKSQTKKAERVKITYTDVIEFYEQVDEIDQVQESEFQKRFEAVERATKGDAELEQLWECIKEGYKRAEIAELMNLKPKQFDKLRERLIDRVRKQTVKEQQK